MLSCKYDVINLDTYIFNYKNSWILLIFITKLSILKLVLNS